MKIYRVIDSYRAKTIWTDSKPKALKIKKEWIEDLNNNLFVMAGCGHNWVELKEFKNKKELLEQLNNSAEKWFDEERQ